MIEQKPSAIEEAPSLADITSSSDRLGKVDFTTKLARDSDVMVEQRDPAVVALTSMARPTRPTDDVDADDDGPRMPFILPPAKVDAAMAVEAERTRQQIAAARGELPEDPDPDEPDSDEPDHDEADSDEAADEQADGTPDHDGDDTGAHAAHAAHAVPVADAEQPKPTRSGPPEGLLIQDVADLEEVGARAAEQAALLEAEQASRREAEEQLRLEAARHEAALAATATATAEAEAGSAAVAALPVIEAVPVWTDAPDEPADDAPDEPADEPVDEPIAVAELERLDPAPPTASRSVDDVAETVIAAMRAVNVAHEQHVDSLELETARRCELLTAQAELDAELIRLHARREAHAIISAARARAGEHDAELAETDQLSEIGETFSRFAETIETTVTSGPGSPDHLRKP